MIFRSLPPPTLLIVDDSPENLQIAGETLSELDCELSFAVDGASALRSIAEELPDLILLDIMMPGLDGLEVCRKVRADPRSAKIPIIFFTAKVEPKDVVAGFEAGGYRLCDQAVPPPGTPCPGENPAPTETVCRSDRS